MYIILMFCVDHNINNINKDHNLFLLK